MHRPIKDPEFIFVILVFPLATKRDHAGIYMRPGIIVILILNVNKEDVATKTYFEH